MQVGELCPRAPTSIARQAVDCCKGSHLPGDTLGCGHVDDAAENQRFETAGGLHELHSTGDSLPCSLPALFTQCLGASEPSRG